MASGCFDLKYNGMPIEYWMENHPVFKEGGIITANPIFSEYKAIQGWLDPDEYFSKDRFTRMLITGGYVAANALAAVDQHDRHELAREKAEMERERKKNRGR